MAEETRREASKRLNKEREALKLDDEQKVAVTTELRKWKNEIKEINAAKAVIAGAVDGEPFTTNEQHAELEEAFDTIRDAAKSVPYKTNIEKFEYLLLQQLTDDLPRFTVGEVATVSRTRRKFWSIKDPQKVVDNIIKSGDYACLTTAIAEVWCNAYYKANGVSPPGVDFWEKTSLSFTKPKKGAK